MSRLPKELQLDLLAEFQVLPDGPRRSRLGKVRPHRTRRPPTFPLPRKRLPHLFREERRGHHHPPRVAQKHDPRFSFPHETPDGRGRPARADEGILEADPGRRKRPQTVMEAGFAVDSLVLDETARRAAFPVCRNQIFLAHAGVTALPQCVADAVIQYTQQSCENHQEFGEVLREIRNTRGLAAKFIGAQAGRNRAAWPDFARAEPVCKWPAVARGRRNFVLRR